MLYFKSQNNCNGGYTLDQKHDDNLFIKKHKGNIYVSWGATAIVVVVVCILAAQLITKLPSFTSYVNKIIGSLAPILYGLIIAYLLDPIMERVAKLLRPRLGKLFKKESAAETCAKAIGVVVSLIVAVLVIYALIALILPQLTDSIVGIWQSLPTYFENISVWVNGLIAHEPALTAVAETVVDRAYEWMDNFLENTVIPRLDTWIATLTSSLWGFAMGLLDVIIGFIVSVYLMMGKTKFLSQGKKILYALLGRKKAGYLCNVCTFANHAFGGFIVGKIVDSAIIGVLCFIGTSILRLPYALLISITVGVTNIIPFFGPFLGGIPCTLLLLVIDPLSALIFAVFVLALQQLDGNVIGPLILGDATGLSSIWVVAAILFFGGVWGIPGMIVGVPLFAVIYQIAKDIINKLAVKRGLSTNSADYEDWNYPPRSTDGAYKIEGGEKKLSFRKQRAPEPKETEPEE